VELERLAVALRPRGGFEAVDLGFQMARAWWRPIWGIWIAVYLPAALLLHLALWFKPLAAMLVLWWLKPVFDRFVLHYVARAVFGTPPTVRETLGAWREILTPGLVPALTLHRLQSARSAMLPVWQLERQTGRAAAERRRVLGRRLSGGFAATIVCLHFEALFVFSVAMAATLLAPGAADAGFEFSDLFRKTGNGEGSAWDLYDSFAYVVAVSVIEPFYVCAGFALYLNRRAVLEGWDIELELRRLDVRLREAMSGAASRAAAAMLAIGLALGIALAATPAPVAAQEKSAREEIREVLKAPEFQQYKEGKRWRYRDEPKPGKDDGLDLSFLERIAAFLSQISQGILWVLAGIAVIGLLLLLRRWIPALAEARAAPYRPPDALFGLALAPESLPADVPGSAAALIDAGRLREALSLLYRGALSVLVHRDHVPLAEGHTEGDCVRAAAKVLPATGAEYFQRLVAAWSGAAYSGRLPDAGWAAALCREWAPHFSARPGAESVTA
jgi:hypothetical protein